MNLFLLAKIVHISSAIFFIGCVYFRTLIVPRIARVLGKERFEETEMALAKPSRAFGRVNNAVLLVSGAYLFYSYFDVHNTFLHVKATLGFAVIALFYSAPYFVPQLAQRIKGFKRYFHHILLLLMLFIVLFSQMMFFQG